jgi:hypothetical protein
MKGLDLRHFQKISDDKKSSKLRHPDGHEIIIAKGSLSPSLRSQLEKLQMAKGGEIEPHKERDKWAIAKSDELAKKHKLEEVKEDRPVPRGTSGNITTSNVGQAYAEGGQADHKDQSILALSKALSRMGDKSEKGVHQPVKSNPGQSAAGQWSQWGGGQGMSEAKSMHSQKLKELQGMKKPVLMADAGDPADAPVADDQNADDQNQVGPSPASVPDQPSPPPGGQMMPTGNNFQAGLPMPAPNPEDLKQKNMNEHQLWANDLYNGHITPKTYSDLYANKSTLGKIGMIFGSALGGAGSGLAHQNNAFIGAMNQQIQNDLQAQMKSKDNAQNYLKLSQAQILAESQGKLTNEQAQALAIPNSLAKMNISAMQHLTDKYNSLPDGSPLKAKYAHQLALAYPAMNEKNSSLAAQAAALEAQFGELNGNQGPSQQNQQILGAVPGSANPNIKVAQQPVIGQLTGSASANEVPASQFNYNPSSYNDEDLKPGSSVAPRDPGAPYVDVDYNKMMKSQFLGTKGVPGALPPGEVGDANKAADQINSTNQALREIHSQFGEMWKSGAGIDTLSPALKDQHLFGVKLPDFAKLGPNAEAAKNYYTAASSVKKQLANVIKGGGSAELYDLIEDQLPRFDDTPDQYRQKLHNVDQILLNQIPRAVMEKYGIAKGLPR